MSPGQLSQKKKEQSMMDFFGMTRDEARVELEDMGELQ